MTSASTYTTYECLAIPLLLHLIIVLLIYTTDTAHSQDEGSTEGFVAVSLPSRLPNSVDPLLLHRGRAVAKAPWHS